MWTVQQGRLAAGLDVTEFVRVQLLDWDGIIARLPPLEAPLAVPGDKNLAVRLDGPHPAPDISSYINDLMADLTDEDLLEWLSGGLDYGSPFTV